MTVEPRVTVPFKGCALFCYPDKESLNAAFMRPQEFYESPFPEIRGKTFTDEQFAARYPAGSYSWDGFNIPGYVLVNFFALFNTTEAEEQIDYSLVGKAGGDGRPFYVIAVHRGEEVAHELAHARWFLDDQYQRTAKRLVNHAWVKYPKAMRALCEWLRAKGYDISVEEDECHAYLATTDAAYWGDNLPAHAPELWAAGAVLRVLLTEELKHAR